jgi:signal recognition particle subunit SEC65
MTAFFVLQPVAVDEQGRRVPDDLPLETPEREKLENAPEGVGVRHRLDRRRRSRTCQSPSPIDKTQLRAAVEALLMRQTTRRSPDWRLRQPLSHPMISTSVSGAPALIR